MQNKVPQRFGVFGITAEAARGELNMVIYGQQEPRFSVFLPVAPLGFQHRNQAGMDQEHSRSDSGEDHSS